MYQQAEDEEINPHILCRELPVLVTGGAGYMASWLVKYLLEDGYKVRVTVRDLSNEDKYKHLQKIAERAKGSLDILEADLMEPDGFKAAMYGCNMVFHTASPYLLSGITNPQKQLIDPSFEGTRNVLEMVNKTSSVKKVVFTSAISAIYGDVTDIISTKEQKFTEDYWNKSSNLKHQPLAFSKTVAEREAWRIHDEQSRWKMVALNPAVILGPSLTTNSRSGSFDFIKKIANGTYKTGVPNVQYGFVDVRDVAQAHIFAAQDQYAEGRFMLVAEVKSMLEVADILHKKFGETFPFPTKIFPKKMLYFFGFTKGFSRKFVVENVDQTLAFDNTKSRHEIGVYYKPIDEAATDLLQYILDHNMLD
ncbi:NAD-dependent epimerase/dehydratase family protein [Reichenbachiella carrageenanivorans]|uniref:NAD-dependent epimerase/dehydratase family protein n=1 Tax=Reichenbachiella carrageenanivorans TaxID=2979869 RepID=A0ABY6D2V0_9BACT|nr:NAD-dependent epimerase/dehydratase family protein [Reichenbachiella carrageenanivorans]UXX80489.1 NAD-dependent epimerase/dehydratase family protein [Reichenbachiella carrageenanivorans]